MLRSIRLVMEKRRGEETPVGVAEHTWQGGDLPSRNLFFAMLEEMYDLVELPFFPSLVRAEVRLDARSFVVEADEPVADPEEVGLALWAAMAKVSSSL